MKGRLSVILISLGLIPAIVASMGDGILSSETSTDEFDSECMDILDLLASLEGFNYSKVEIAKRLFGDEKINFEVETWRGKCYYGIGTLNGKVVIVSNKPFRNPTLLAYSDSKTVKFLFKNPDEKLFIEALKSSRIRIEGVGMVNTFKVGLVNIISGFFMPQIMDQDKNATLNITKPVFVFNFTSPEDYDGDGINNSVDMCDPKLLKEKLNTTGEIIGDEEVKYYLCPSFSSRDREVYHGNSPYIDIYDYTTDNGCGIKDTDGGLRYYTKGSICVESVGYAPSRIVEGPFGQVRGVRGEVYSECKRVYTDYCIDDKTLVEYYYEPPRQVVVNNPLLGPQTIYISGGVKNKTYECPLGCYQGACVCRDVEEGGRWERGEFPPLHSGTESGFLPYMRGFYGVDNIEYLKLAGKHSTFGDTCLDERTLKEYYTQVTVGFGPLSAGGLLEDRCELKSKVYACSYCSDRRCWEGDLEITKAEAVQVVYGAPLIKDKGTAFRILVNSTFDQPVDVEIELELPDSEWEIPIPNYPDRWIVNIPANAVNFEVMLPVVPQGSEKNEVSQINPAGLITPAFTVTPIPNGWFGPLNVTYRNAPRPITDEVSFTVRLDPDNVIGETNEGNNNITVGGIEVKTTKPFKIMFFIHVPNSSYFYKDNVTCSVQAAKGCKPTHNLTKDQVRQIALDMATSMAEYILGVSPIADEKMKYGIDLHIRAESDFGDASVYREAMLSFAKSWGYDYAISMDPCDSCGVCVRGASICNVGIGGAAAQIPTVGHELLSHGILKFGEECYACTPYRGNKSDVDCESCVASEGFWVNEWRKYEEGYWQQRNGGWNIVNAKYYACGNIPVEKTWQRLNPLWKWSNKNHELPGGYLDLIEEFEDQNDPVVLLVEGEVYRNGTAKFGTFKLIEGHADIEANAPGDYYIILLDSENRILAKYGFNLSFELMSFEGVKELDKAFFVFNVLWNNETKKIELRDKEGNILASKLVSQNKPEIKVLSPKEGDVFGENESIVIKWEANDPDGDLLTYSVGLSSDGKNWVPLVGELRNSEYVIDTSQLVRGNYTVKLMVSDGVYTAEALSGTFFVDVPEIKIEKEICGNDFCNIESENSLNCPQDCPTGIKDNICDAVKDNRVDPDCEEGKDPDDTIIYETKIAERHGESNLLVYGVLLAGAVLVFALLGSLYILVRKIKK